MIRSWDRFTRLFRQQNGPRRPAPVRPTVHPQLEQLEKRDVPTVGVSIGPPTIQQIEQSLQNIGTLSTLDGIVQALPAISQTLSQVNFLLPQIVGQQQAAKLMPQIIEGVENYILQIEVNTLNALQAAGDWQDYLFNADAQAISYFLYSPLNDPYSYPPGEFGS